MQLEASAYTIDKTTGNYSNSLIDYLKSKSIISDISGEEDKWLINVTTLLGSNQAMGNGTYPNDVYVLEKQDTSTGGNVNTKIASTMPIKIAETTTSQVTYEVKYYGNDISDLIKLGTLTDGNKNNNNQEDIKEMTEIGNKIAILNEKGELSSINFERPYNSQIMEIDMTGKTLINTNVKELFSNGSYLTNNGEIYIFSIDDMQYYKKADNVKKIYPDKDMAYISTENELFFFDWANPVTGKYEKHAENVKEFFGDYSYSMLDGTSKVRLMRDGSYITVEENIRYLYNGYYITSEDALYRENTSVRGEFNKVADNVKEFNGWNKYLSNDEELFVKSNGTFSKVAENVKQWDGGDLYVNGYNELYEYVYDEVMGYYSKIAENVKAIGKHSYISLDNKVFIKDDNSNYVNSGYEILKYGIKNNLWFKTTDNKIYYYYNGGVD